jgi:hypothetical protein
LPVNIGEKEFGMTVALQNEDDSAKFLELAKETGFLRHSAQTGLVPASSQAVVQTQLTNGFGRQWPIQTARSVILKGL